MKKFVIFTLMLAMVLSMVGCGCDHQWQDATCSAPKTCTRCGETSGEALEHTTGQLEIVSVDTAALTITYQLPCSTCGTVIETKDSSTGVAPVAGVMALSAEEWNACLATNIQQLGASQSLFPYPAEPEDDAVVHAVVSMYGMQAAISYYDTDGNVLTSAQKDTRNLIHNIYVQAQFTNDTAKEFFMFLMIVAMNNNSAMSPEYANTMAAQIMTGNTVTDNGYTYSMGILSAEDHTVYVDITADA